MEDQNLKDKLEQVKYIDIASVNLGFDKGLDLPMSAGVLTPSTLIKETKGVLGILFYSQGYNTEPKTRSMSLPHLSDISSILSWKNSYSKAPIDYYL